MYCRMYSAFMPMRPQGSDSQMNSRSMSTASRTISVSTLASSGLSSSLHVARACGTRAARASGDVCSAQWTSRTGHVCTWQACKGEGGARVHVAGKVGVEALVARDELVAEGEAGHEAALLQPENGAEAPAEEDALHARKRHEAVRKGLVAARAAPVSTGGLACMWRGAE